MFARDVSKAGEGNRTLKIQLGSKPKPRPERVSDATTRVFSLQVLRVFPRFEALVGLERGDTALAK
jgi:hypothetical protein